MLIYSLTALLIIILDQLTKYFTVSSLAPGEGFALIPHIIDIYYVKNTGAAFSILEEHTVLLGIVSFVFCAAVIVYAICKKPKHPLLRISLTMIFAGALGNGIDRVMRHFVVDMLKTVFISFPVFNVADIAVTVGAALLIIYVIFFDKSGK